MKVLLYAVFKVPTANRVVAVGLVTNFGRRRLALHRSRVPNSITLPSHHPGGCELEDEVRSLKTEQYNGFYASP